MTRISSTITGYCVQSSFFFLSEISFFYAYRYVSMLTVADDAVAVFYHHYYYCHTRSSNAVYRYSSSIRTQDGTSHK
jgi:hypothetical protein